MSDTTYFLLVYQRAVFMQAARIPLNRSLKPAVVMRPPVRLAFGFRLVVQTEAIDDN